MKNQMRICIPIFHGGGKIFKLSLMRLLCCVMFAFGASAQGQAGEWTWMGGQNTVGTNGSNPGVYGTLGQPAAGNIPAGRIAGNSWTDSAGNFWLFGGEGVNAGGQFSLLNDLWEFNPTANKWTWKSGSNTISNDNGGGSDPGSREGATSWTDKNGNFWLFGGSGEEVGAQGGGGFLNDMWEYSNGSWGLVSIGTGSNNGGIVGTIGTPAVGNVPSSRNFAESWTDKDGNFWLFGGFGLDDSSPMREYLNDLWMFNPTTGAWTCLTQGRVSVVYGTQGVPSTGNTPGGLEGGSSWADSNGHFWLFGGSGSPGPNVANNNMWEYYPSTNQWAWISGGNGSAVYGTLGVPAAGNIPGALGASVQWTDNNGNFWIYGGGDDCCNIYPDGIYENDFWMFNPTTNEWTWMGGSNVGNAHAVFGTLGVPSPLNGPGGRQGSASWTDSTGNLWLFGGGGELIGTSALMNDMWKYQLTNSILPSYTVSFSPSSLTITAGQSGTTTITVTPAGGFNSAVTFSCGGLPAGAACSFSPASASSPSWTTTMTVSTSATTTRLDKGPLNHGLLGQGPNPLLPITAVAGLLCCFGLRKRGGLQMLLMLLVCGVGLSVLNGCGGGSTVTLGGVHTPHTILVTATSGALTSSATFTLTVN